MSNAWMVRSDGGTALELFEDGLVGIGASIPEDLSSRNQDEIRELYSRYNPDDSKGRANGAVGMIERFVNVMAEGDIVITYDPGTRQYWVGTFEGDYYMVAPDEYLPHRRRVRWEAQTVLRDDLSVSARNSLGSTLTLFSVSDEVWGEVQALLRGERPDPEEVADEVKVGFEQDKRNVKPRSRPDGGTAGGTPPSDGLPNTSQRQRP